MPNKNLYTENTEENGLHRGFLSINSNFLHGNKWGKENFKFFGDFGSPRCLPCTKNEEQLGKFTQEMKIM